MNPKLSFQRIANERRCDGCQKVKVKSSSKARGSASGAICGLTRRSAQGRFTRCNLAALNSRKGSTRERRKSSKKSKLIAKLPADVSAEFTAKDEKAINAAWKAYSKLTSEQKTFLEDEQHLLDCYNKAYPEG